MNHLLDFLARHGTTVLFAAVFVEQMGIPLPAAPWLLAAGALAGTNKINWTFALIAASLGSLVADLFWFYLGRYSGNRVLKFLCRISLEPDSCVRRTQNVFTRFGMRGLLVAKFIPGLSLLVSPLAGSSGVKTPKFIFFDTLGSMLYVGCFLILGVVFRHQLDQVMAWLSDLGGNALILVVALITAYITFKFIQRHRLLRQLKTSRITVDELNQILVGGGQPIILDLRPLAELEQDPAIIRGARHTTMDEVNHRKLDLPGDRDIILYCSCPNEVSSARLALELRRKGIERVRPLLGGFDAWRERNYPMELCVIGIVNPVNPVNLDSLSAGAKS